MLKAARHFLVLILVVASGAAIAAPLIKPYVRDDLASDVVRLTETLRKETAQIGAKVKGKSADALRKDAAAAVIAGDYKGASVWLGAAVAADPKDSAAWLALAKLGAQADDAQADGRYDLVEHGQTAAYAAYQRASAAPQQAEALALLGDLFARHEMWRPALDAYRASLDRRDSEDTQKTYEDLREKHGFRIVDYKVDNESSAPRICFNFSEALAHKTDFTPYVAVAGAADAAISVEDQQICVEGVKHGERYAIVLREGLPSAVGEALLKSADYEVYVRDRSPQAHFAGKAYVLPRQGQLGAPLTTVNTDKVSIAVYRIGDRNLLAETARDDFLKPITASRAGDIETQDGVKVWTGTMDVASALNQDVVTDFPILTAVGKLDPGVYLVTARPWKGASAPAAADDDNDDATMATQWMVVSDLGLTTFSGDDGVHVLARSLATALPLAGVEVRLVARNNEVLATKSTGPDGRADFDPGLSRGTGGSAPGLLVATLGDDYGFLNLGQPAFDLTDRGVGGRDAPNGLDAFVYTERGVYRSGETVFVTALLRDAKSAAVTGLPLTLVVKRPDGVEYKRVLVADQGLGGHALAAPLLSDAAPGKWEIDAYADPKGASIGHAEFLLEDYVPERLDFALKTAQTAATPGEPIDVSLEARFLYGAPATGLDVTGAIRLEAVRRFGAGRLPRLRRRPDRRRLHHHRKSISRQAADRRQGPRRSLGRSPRWRRGQAAAGQDHRRCRRSGRPHGRARHHAAGARQGRDDRGQGGFRREPGPGRSREFRSDCGGGQRDSHDAQGRLVVALPAQRRLPVVQRRRALELRTGQVVEAPRRRDFRHRSAGAGQVQRPGRLGPPPPRHQIRRRRRDQHHVRCRLVGNRRARHARQRRRHARQGELRARR